MILKWVGSKRRHAPAIADAIGSIEGCGTYWEPFFGAGHVYFEFARRGWLPDFRVVSDANPWLVAMWIAVRDHPNVVAWNVGGLAEEYLTSEDRSAIYSAWRQEFNQTGEAALLIVLNRTCYNGLFRVNASRGFNVPHGRYKQPAFPSNKSILEASRLLKGTDICECDYKSATALMQSGDFVYIDPPYYNTFAGYTSEPFGDVQQQELAREANRLRKFGARVVLSNRSCVEVEQLYQGWKVQRLARAEVVNCSGRGRGQVEDVLLS